MAGYIVRQSTELRRALQRAFSLQSRILGHPDTSVKLRFIRHDGSEEKTEEYKFVERLIPPSRVPTPRLHTGNTPSGWRPSAYSLPLLPYMIRRSRMHNIPVYTDVTHGNRKTTLIRKVEGDIWALERDVKKYLKEVTGKELPTQVNEVTMSLRIKGHFDVELKEWLVNKGF